MPIYSALKEYIESRPAIFHMPGHKMGRGLPGDIPENLLSMDLTEIPGLDNLHYPSGIIKEAQELASKAFCSDRTYFLVNGSTCGVHSMILTMCKPGDKLIVARDCHRSVIAGMMLAGVNPVYIKPGYDAGFGIPTVIDPHDMEETLNANPDAVGVLITRPNYYGVCADIDTIVKLVHSHDKIIAVDEAHGAHLCFNDKLPSSAMQAGADICVQSAHKTLPAITQSAYLHVQGRKIDMERLEFYLRILQTSSPSYMMMSLMDLARALMETQGAGLIGELLEDLRQFRNTINDTGNLSVLQKGSLDNIEIDETRLVINLNNTGITGFEMEKILRETYRIQVEMADYNNIVCITTVSDREEDFARLSSSLCEVAGRLRGNKPLRNICGVNITNTEQIIGLKDLPEYKGEYVSLDRAHERICLDMVTPYPPGIPLICPGEKIGNDAVEAVKEIIAAGGTVNGVINGNEIRVLV